MTYIARVRSTAGLCVIGALLAPLIASAQPSTISDKYVVINGMADPAAIPEYAAWRHALTMFALREKGMSSQLRDELALSAVEYALLAGEASQEKVRRDACHQRQARVTEEGEQAGWRPSRLQEAMDSVVLECRQDILAAADRLMAKLSDDGRHKVSEFVERSKSTLEMFVEKDRVAFFRQPR